MKTILLVDDDAQIRALLREILSIETYAITEATNGAEGLALAMKKKFDLIITDRAMPEMDGLAMLKALKDSRRLVPSLMISAYGEEKTWGDAVSYGAVDYLLKPFQADEILQIVKKTLTSGGKAA